MLERHNEGARVGSISVHQRMVHVALPALRLAAAYGPVHDYRRAHEGSVTNSCVPPVNSKVILNPSILEGAAANCAMSSRVRRCSPSARLLLGRVNDRIEGERREQRTARLAPGCAAARPARARSPAQPPPV